MGILALDKRSCLRGILAIAHDIAVLHVHRAVDIGFAILEERTLVLDRTGRIHRLYQIIGIIEVGTGATFVAQRPENNGRMVAVALDIAAVALKMGVMENGILGKGTGPVSHAVGLHVRLGDHIYSILVAEVIPVAVIGIVRGAYRIDIEFLHDADILLHSLARHDIASVRVKFVAVRSLEQHRLSVHQYLRILNLNLAETGLDRNHLRRNSLIKQGRNYCI